MSHPAFHWFVKLVVVSQDTREKKKSPEKMVEEWELRKNSGF
jgi:hypothetical protein